MPAAIADLVKSFPLTLEKSAAPEFDARFVLSASSPDRVKDTIDPAAYQPHLRKRLIALWQHEREKPIGYWQNLKVEAGALVGEIKFASTALAQMVKTLIADGVPLGASIGFRAKGEPNDIGGLHFRELELLETSIVSVPAHPRAVQIAKQFGFSLDAVGQLPAIGAPASSSPSAVAASSSPKRSKAMGKTISQLVVETQEKQVELVDRLAVESGKLGESAAGTDEFTTQKAIVDGIDAELQAVDGKLASLKAAEARLANGAQPVSEQVGSANIVQFRDKSKDTENLFGKLALCIYESSVKSMDVETVAARRFPNSQAVETIVKAAVNPAMSNVAGWAQELTRTGYGQFMDMLRAQALLPRIVPQGQSHSFEGNMSITIPIAAGGPTDLSGAFRAEGAPIPVKRTTFASAVLTPKNLGVIVTATAEMLRRSAIDLAGYLQRRMVSDTATLLDQVFLSNSAATAVSPAGIRAGLAAGDTRASTGATAAAIQTDIKAMLTALATANMGGPNTRWLMHPKNYVAVSWLQTATGTRVFPETTSGTLAGYPVVQSTTMDPAIVLLVDFDYYSFAIGAPAFMASLEATLHEDNAPAPISATGTPNVVAAPTRSLYQTNTWALRMLLDVDWAKMRTPGPVQELTAVAW